MKNCPVCRLLELADGLSLPFDSRKDEDAICLTRWQHLMNREHPTGTERKSLNYECGWKGGDRGGLAARKKFAERKKLWKRAKKLLTGVGLLMGLATRFILSWNRVARWIGLLCPV